MHCIFWKFLVVSTENKFLFEDSFNVLFVRIIFLWFFMIFIMAYLWKGFSCGFYDFLHAIFVVMVFVVFCFNPLWFLWFLWFLWSSTFYSSNIYYSVQVYSKSYWPLWPGMFSRVWDRTRIWAAGRPPPRPATSATCSSRSANIANMQRPHWLLLLSSQRLFSCLYSKMKW